ncbi:MAG: 3-hydroxyacyl-CoA dehydrogenase NAD-binding domain-containing protein [Chloroflexota bacterium]
MAEPTRASEENVLTSEEERLPSIVGVVGAGTMGSGIAQVALEAGCEVVLYDVDEAAVERGRQRIVEGLARRAAKLELDLAALEDWVGARLERVRHVPTLDGLADEADLVIESALEDLALKQTIFATLDDVAGPDIILATNTSALSVAEIAQATTRPERVIGLHFFNPAPVMALVEVVVPPLADPAVVARAVATVSAWGKTPVVCADLPGFIVNRVNRPFTIEALRILESGAASVGEIDDALRAEGFPMGPFELMDLTGIDITLAAATGVWEGLGRPDRLRPSPIQERLVEAGALGRKTGRGFYHYVEGRRTDVAETSSNTPSGESLSPPAIRERILAAIAEEARLAAAEGVATAETIDLALRLGAGHPHAVVQARP